MRFYYFLGRLLKPVMTVGFFLFCVVTRTPRVRVVVRNENDEVLLVQTWLSGNEWSFPGGGVDRGESLEDAACRELREETGITVTMNQLERLSTIRTWGHEEVIFSLLVPQNSLPEVLPSRFEVKEAAWFADLTTLQLGSLAKQITTEVAINR